MTRQPEMPLRFSGLSSNQVFGHIAPTRAHIATISLSEPGTRVALAIIMKNSILPILALGFLSTSQLLVGCAAEQDPIEIEADADEDIINSLDEKADLSSQIKPQGVLANSIVEVAHTGNPRFSSLRFTAKKGALISISVATNCGPNKPVAFLVNSRLRTIARGVPTICDGETSQVTSEIEKLAIPADGVYQVLFRDADRTDPKATFSISLSDRTNF
jgi:hypothetical protein